MRVAELEESLRDLEEIRQRQANRIEELTATLETKKAAKTTNLVQQSQSAHFSMNPNDASQSLEESSKETQEVTGWHEDHVFFRGCAWRVFFSSKQYQELKSSYYMRISFARLLSLHANLFKLKYSNRKEDFLLVVNNQYGSHGKFLK